MGLIETPASAIRLDIRAIRGTCRDIDARADGLSGPPRVFSVLSDLCLAARIANES